MKERAQITFEELPKAFEELIQKLERIEEKLQSLQADPADDVLTIEETAEFLGLAKRTIYGLVNKEEIPCSKRGKRLYFSKKELCNWLKDGTRHSHSKIRKEALNHLGGHWRANK